MPLLNKLANRQTFSPSPPKGSLQTGPAERQVISAGRIDLAQLFRLLFGRGLFRFRSRRGFGLFGCLLVRSRLFLLGRCFLLRLFEFFLLIGV
jgi:hypothetical protein